MMMQLALAIIIANFLLGKYNALSEVLKITAKFSDEDTYMYMPSLFDSESRGEKLKFLLDKYKSEIIFEQSIGGFYWANDGKEYEICALGDTTSRTLVDSTTTGKWYTDAAASPYVPCVTYYQDHELGDIIKLNMDNHLVEFRVVGTVSKSANILKFRAASNLPKLELMFENNWENSPYPLILFNQADIPYEFDVIADSNALVYFRTDNNTIRENILQELRDIVWVVPLKDARFQSKDQLMIHVKTLAPMIVSIFLVGLVSTLCLTVLNSIRHMRIVSIYYISGMSWISNLVAFIIYMVLQIAGVCLVVYAFFLFNNSVDMMPMEITVLNELNAIMTIGIIFTTVAVALLTQIFIRKKETPIKYIKESW
jgi:hypothetical protein